MRRLTLLFAALASSGCWQMHEQPSVRPHENPQMAPVRNTVAVNQTEPIPASLGEAAAVSNPLPPGPAVVEAGHMIYRRNCWACHGPALDGESNLGNLIATVGPSLPHLRRSLLDPAILAQSDGVLFWKIYHWSGAPRYSCPPLGSTLRADDIWRVIHYVRAVAAGEAPMGEPAGFRYGAVPVDQARLDLYRNAAPATP